MGAPRQAVDHRHGGRLGQFEQVGMAEDADHDRIDIAAHHLGGVGQSFLAAQLHLLAGEHDGFAPELAHADIEGDTGAGGLALEDHRQHLVLEEKGPIAFLEALLEGARLIEHAAQFGIGKIVDGEKMVRGAGRRHGPGSFVTLQEMGRRGAASASSALSGRREQPASAPPEMIESQHRRQLAEAEAAVSASMASKAAPMRAMASSISASETISGGSSRSTLSPAPMARSW